MDLKKSDILPRILEGCRHPLRCWATKAPFCDLTDHLAVRWLAVGPGGARIVVNDPSVTASGMHEKEEDKQAARAKVNCCRLYRV